MPNYTKDWKIYQIMTGSFIAFGGFGFGCTLAWTATALPSLDALNLVGPLSKAEKSWIASITTIGALVACPVTGLFLRESSRKASLICFSVVGFVAWVFLGTAKAPVHLYLGRILLGVASGGYTILIPIYISEIASKEYRGFLGSMFVLMLGLGKLYSNAVGIYFPEDVASLLCALVPALYMVLLSVIPESPKILLLQNKEKEAFKAISRFETRGTNGFVFVASEPDAGSSHEACSKFEEMKLQNSSQTIKSPASDDGLSRPSIFSKEMMKPVLTVFIQMALSQFCGINISTFYTVELFRMSGEDLIDSEYATLILAVIQTIGCIPCSIFVDKYGRKVLLTTSFLFLGLSAGALSAFIYVKKTCQWDIHPVLGVTPLVALIVYNLAYSWGVGSVVWITLSELLPPSIIGAASAIANVIFWGCAFLLIQSFQMFMSDSNLSFWFLSFAVVCTFGFIFNAICMPETKGLTFDEIQRFYKGTRKEKELQQTRI